MKYWPMFPVKLAARYIQSYKSKSLTPLSSFKTCFCTYEQFLLSCFQFYTEE